MSFKGCIYELDGVVANIAPFRYASWQWIAEELGYSLSSKQYQKLTDLDSKAALERILRWSISRISEAEKQRLLQERKSLYLNSLNELTEENILTGFRSFNKELRDNGIKVALISPNKYTIRIVDKLDLVMDLDAVVDGDMIDDGLGKEALFHLACEKIQLNPEHCLVIHSENSDLDYLKNHGFKTMERKGGKSHNGALKYINSWSDITQNQLSDLFAEDSQSI